MAIVLLTNKNSKSQYHKLAFDLMTGKCVLDEKHEIERQQLSDLGFEHPLLMDKTLEHSNTLFHHEYDSFDGLFHAANYVYSILLNADNPLACRFKITPSTSFQRSYNTGSIYFSICSYHVAKELISIEQLEAIVTHLSGYSFRFFDALMINQEFTVKDLPNSIDGDLLDTADVNFVPLLKASCDLKRYELRYISPTMGFGVFSREPIKNGESLFFYGGVKKMDDISDASYAFNYRRDCLKMYSDAREYGNLARFINHAPDPNKDQKLTKQSTFLDANVHTTSNYINGIEIIVFAANRDISPGEQLLVDYGKIFFRSVSMSRFKQHGKPSLKQALKNSSQKRLTQIRIMAKHGVKQAQQFLLLRVLSRVIFIVVIMGILASIDISWFTG